MPGGDHACGEASFLRHPGDRGFREGADQAITPAERLRFSDPVWSATAHHPSASAITPAERLRFSDIGGGLLDCASVVAITPAERLRFSDAPPRARWPGAAICDQACGGALFLRRHPTIVVIIDVGRRTEEKPMTSYYKLTTHDGWDLFTGSTVNYRAACGAGVPLHCPTEPSSSGPALCQPGVLHASLTPRATFSGLDRERQGLDRLALWEVVGDPVVDDGRTVGFRALLVVRELPLIATVWGAGYHERIAWVHDELIPAVREIPWLRPPEAPVYEHLEVLATEHLLALSEWGDTGPLPLRVVSGRADAAVAAADAADAADAVAAGDVG